MDNGDNRIPEDSNRSHLTAVFACSLACDFLPLQLIDSGKTPACLPKATFIPDWHITYTHNHWVNEASMTDYAQDVLFPIPESNQEAIEGAKQHPGHGTI